MPPIVRSYGRCFFSFPSLSLFQFWGLADEGTLPIESMRDPSVKMSLLTVSSDGGVRWITCAERVVGSTNGVVRVPVFSVAEHKMKAFETTATHADAFFVSRTFC